MTFFKKISRWLELTKPRYVIARKSIRQQRRRLLLEALEGRRVLTSGDPFQSFDGVVAPALPADWFVSHTGAGTPWATTSGAESFEGVNHAFISNPTSQSEGILKSAGYTPTADSPIISFVHRYDTEANFDGGVLEIALPGLPYVDILTAGGSFLAGGYNSTISPTSTTTPLAGRQAWSGDSGGYVITTVQLPPSHLGNTIRLQWRFATDSSVGDVGWRVDSVNFVGPIKPIELATLTPTQGTTVFGAGDGDLSGKSVSVIGDVNGDGYDDMLIGAPYADGPNNNLLDAGEAFLLLGSPTVAAATIDLASAVPLGFGGIGDQFGGSVGSAGDVNGDGFADFFVGADKAALGAGETHLFFGNGSATNFSRIKFVGIDAGDKSGYSVSHAGDVNGDGFSDLIIGAYKAASLNNGAAGAGESYLIFGKANWTANQVINLATLGQPGQTAGVTFFGVDANDYSGISVSSAGDFNGDGFDDLVIGADGGEPSFSFSSTNFGETYIIFGKRDWSGIASVQLETLTVPDGITIFGADPDDRSGHSVTGVGDFNGDGFDDVAIGAYSAESSLSGETDTGHSYIVFGKSDWTDTPTVDLFYLNEPGRPSGVTIFGADTNDYSGISVSGGGDVNGDGLDDLVIGAIAGDARFNTRSDSGDTYVVFGKQVTPSTIDLASLGRDSLAIFGVDFVDRSGNSVSLGGDVNGDGFDDLLIGAQYAASVSNGRSNAGESYLLFGGNGFTNSIEPLLLGNNGDNSLLGSSGPKLVNGADGNDTLLGDGGGDVLLGGRGNDLIEVLDLDFKRIVGGNGSDRLRIGTSGLSLNLTTIPDNRIVDIETIEINGSSLTLNELEVLNISGSTNTLTVIGTTGSRVIFESGWSRQPDDNGFQVFTKGEAKLRISDGVVVQVVRVLDLNNLGLNGTTIQGQFLSDYSGFSVSNAGDINGDGYDDVIVGAPAADNSTVQYGNAAGISYVVFGGPSLASSINLGNLGSAGITIMGQTAEDKSGFSVSSAGDFDGDGFDDLIIGAPTTDLSGTRAGKSYVVFGKAIWSGTPVTLSDNIGVTNPGVRGVTFLGQANNDYSGYSVSTAGDVNGDGFDDLIIGATGGDPGTPPRDGAGNSYVIFGKANWAATPTITLSNSLSTPGITLLGEGASDRSGVSVSGAGDINADGFDDLVIGAERADPLYLSQSSAPVFNGGKSYVIFGAPSLPSTITLSELPNIGSPSVSTLAILGQEFSYNSGHSVSSAGDVNGDGIDDLIIGELTDLSLAPGKSYVIFGKTSFSQTITLSDSLGTNGFTIVGQANGDRIGTSVSSAGDVNGDGFDDLIVGAPYADPTEISPSDNHAGKSYLIFGKSNWTTTNLITLSDNLSIPGISILGQAAFDRSGQSVSGAGDVNGDGFDDLIVGAPDADLIIFTTNDNEGKSYIIYGGNHFTLSIVPNNLGTNTANTINGTAGAQILNGANGDDILVGLGGADVLLGGRGNDTLAISDLTFKRIVGGNGSDTLRLDGSGITLDLTTIRDNRILDIETIDITGSGNNTLTLTAREVLNLSTHSDTLIVRRNIGDVVNRGAGWTQLASELISGVNFEVFTQGAATLKVLGSQAPVIGSIGAAANYNPGGPRVLVFPTATISDPDTVNFANAVLTVTNTNGQSTDSLAIIPTATITVASGNVLFNGTIMGSFTGGTGTTPLAFTFNNQASFSRVQLVLNTIGFASSLPAPSTTARTVSVQVTDGAGGISTLQSKLVNINQNPIIGSIGAAVSYNPNGPRVLVFPTATITDPNTVNFANAVLTVTNTNGQSTDTLAIIPTAAVTVSAGNVLFNGTIIGSFVGGVGTTPFAFTFNNQASFARVQLVLNAIGFASSSAAPSTTARTITVRVTDGVGGISTLQSKLVNINQIPVIGSIGAAASYKANGPRVLVYPTATITDPDTVNFANAVLTVTNTNGQATDSLAIIPTANITISGTNVLFLGTIMGTFVGGNGTTPLAFTFNNQASFARVQLVLNAVGFASSLNTPSTTARTVTARVTDGLGGISVLQSKLVNIIPNLNPVIGSIGATVTYNPTSPKVLVFPTATITDADTVNFANAVLTVTNTNGQATDNLAIVPTATITVSAANVLFNGTIIGSFTGGAGTTPLAFTFNNQASFARVQLVLNAIGFDSSLPAPSPTARTVSVQVTDGVGGTSSLQSKLVNINQAPVIGSIGAAATYNATTAARVLVFPTATITDPDTVNFANAVLTVTNTNGQATDSLAIIPTAIITVSGASVRFNGTVIGSFTGGTGTTPLAFTFNNQASFSRVQLVLNAIGFASSLPAPITTPRTISVRVTDGIGGTSALQSKLVNII